MAKQQTKPQREQADDGMSIMTVSQLPAVLRSEIAEQISAARQWPRDIVACKEECQSLVASDADMAESCLYALRREGRDGKVSIIKGPSIRFAEVLAYSWHNCRSGARIVDEGEKFLTAQGVFVDVERNNVITIDVQRRITTNKGRRFGDDMVMVTGNAASSVALRNAILRGVPKAIWGPIYEACETMALGDEKRLIERRQRMIEHFQKLSVTEKELFDYLKVNRIDQIGVDELTLALTVAQSIKDGQSTIDQVFRSPESEGDAEETQTKVTTSTLGDGRKSK